MKGQDSTEDGGPDMELTSSRAIPTIRVTLTPQGPRIAQPIICQCLHADHIAADIALRSEGGSRHFSGARVAYVVRAWDDGPLLICADCDRAGHRGRASS